MKCFEHMRNSARLFAAMAGVCVLTGTAWGQAPALPDPAVPPADQVQLLPAVATSHPRILFTQAELTALRNNYASSPFWTRLTSYLPSCVPPTNTNYVSDGTDAQRQGFWRAPTVAVHYAITGNTTSFNNAKGFLDHFIARSNWDTTSELNSGMCAANILIGAAVVYDTLYNDLTPTYRAQVRTKLLDQARDMYYGGHLMYNNSTHYWEWDPQNNHRLIRDGGLAAAVLAIADPTNPDDDWILKKMADELAFVHQWLPADGSNHEGTHYQPFGNNHLAVAFSAADRCLGTNYLAHPYFSNVVAFRVATLTPGLTGAFAFGDAVSGSVTNYNNYTLLGAAKHNQADGRKAMLDLFATNPNATGPFDFGWMSVIWDNQSLTGGSINNLPKKYYFDDIGFFSVRDGWASNNVGMMLKCGPFGGKRLNEFRDANNFVNIMLAHTDPDANEFQIYGRGQMLAQTDGYSTAKWTSGHNTILVNGVGQRNEGEYWTQPIKNESMANMATLKTPNVTLNIPEAQKGLITVAEGEAKNAYAVGALNRYRRTTAFSAGKYILVLDDIRPTSSTPITWMVQSSNAAIVSAAQGRCSLTAGAVTMPFTLLGNVSPTLSVVTSTAQSNGASMNLKQVRAVATTTQWRTAAMFDAWGKGNLNVTFTPISQYVSEVRVTGTNIDDYWIWDSTGDTTNLTLSVPGSALVTNRKVFYKNSKFDGNGNVALEDSAIAPDKVALLPGQTATFANYTSYSRGINGIIVDVMNPFGTISAADFTFKVGNSNTPGTWATAPAPTSVTTRSGPGGATRVSIVWANNAIQKQWLQVTLKANGNTGLPADDVFYFGNAVGEAGDSATNAMVNPSDEYLTRINPRTLLNQAPIDFPYDFDRDGLVNPSDGYIARINPATLVTAIKLITVP